MSVDAGIPCSASQVLVFPVSNVNVRLWVTILLCQAKVNYVDLIGPLSKAHQKVVRFDVPMNEAFSMNKLNPAYLHTPQKPGSGYSAMEDGL